MSEDSETETGTILTSTGTTTSSFTIPGPGALSGKAIKRFGTLVVKGVDAIVYRRRLARIESILQEDPDAMTNMNLEARERLYHDLFELSRSVYNVSIRTRAFRLIMRKIGEMDLNDIAAAIVHLWSSKWQDDLGEMLTEILFCLRTYREPRLVSNVLDGLRHDESAKLKPYHLAGLNAYGYGILKFSGGIDISTAVFRAPFLILLRLMVSLSTTPTISRALVGLEVLEFIIETWFQEIGPWYEDSAEALLQAVLEKLDLIQDIQSISYIQELVNHRVALKLTVHPKTEFKAKKEVGLEFEPLEFEPPVLEPLEFEFPVPEPPEFEPLEMIARQLPHIEYILQKDFYAVTNLNTPKLYSDLLESSRLGHTVLIRARAFRLIMHKIGRRDSRDLAIAIVQLPSCDYRGLLWDMFFCMQMYRLMPDVTDALRKYESAPLMSYYLEGLDAYGHDFARQVDVPRPLFRAPFLVSLHSMVSLSTSPAFSRVLLGLGVLEFIIETSFQEVGHEDPGESLLQAILGKLDPIQDISWIQGLNSGRLAMKSTVRPEVKSEAVVIQRLSVIEYVLQQKESDAMTNLNFQTQEHYSDLLEWSRSKYSVSIRTKAFHLIMRKIGRRDSEDLANAIVHLPSLECQDLLWDMFFCIRMYKETRSVPDILDALRDASAPFSLTCYYLAGLGAYGHEACEFPQEKVDVPRAVFRAPFLISLRSMVSLSTSPTFSRVLVELGIQEFILETSFQGVGSQYEDLGLSLLQVIQEKLNSIQDIHSISQI